MRIVLPQLTPASRSRAGIWDGESATRMPAASRAAHLARRRPRAAEMIAPAWPIRRPAGAVRPAMKAATGRPRGLRRAGRRLLLVAPPISPISTIASVSGSALSSSRTSMKVRPDDRVAADPDAGRLAHPGVGHRLDHLVGERARAADTRPTGPGRWMIAGDDPDLGPADRRRAGAVGPDQPRTAIARGPAWTRSMSRTGIPSVMQMTSRRCRRPPPRGWRRGRTAAGTKMQAAFGAGLRRPPRRPCRRPGPARRPLTGRPCRGSRRRRCSSRTRASPAQWNSPSRPVMPWTRRRVSRPTRMLMRAATRPAAAATALRGGIVEARRP